MSTSAPLAGQRVLIVEDRYLIASEMADEVDRMGGEVVGPVRDLSGAATAIAQNPPDLALLDVNLDGELVYPLAATLAAKQVPFVFLTGYDEEILPAEWRDRPRLSKPVNGRVLREELVKLCGAPPPSPR